MTTVYSIWHRETANIVAEFTSEADALAELQAWLQADGPAGLERLALWRDNETDGPTTLIGPDLVAYVRAALTATVPAPGDNPPG